MSSSPAHDLAAEVESGPRQPTGAAGRVLALVALAWSLFQLWYASPLPFVLGFGLFNDTEARAIHLAFALLLAFTAFPALKSSPRQEIPWHAWLLGIAAAFCAAYILIFYAELAHRAGAPSGLDLAVALAGLLLLLEASRRALGSPLMIVALVFLAYTFGGPWMPEVIAHKGQSLAKVMSHQWLTTEGVFGIALGVSTSFVFLFVLFGALLEKAGAGSYFIRLSFALLGHLRGGPAKAAVVASATTGLISGSSIANVATTGTFTIPLMKRVGFPASKAGAVEVASSTNGQLTPPVMGAAAFLMIEYVGISYLEVMKHAILPALISYIALFYIVHLEAVKAGMQGLPRRQRASLAQRLLNLAGLALGLCLVGFGVYYGIGWLKPLAGDWALPLLAGLVLIAYLGLLAYASRQPPAADDDPDSLAEVPELGPTLKSGLHFLLPIVVLMWCLIVERLSPGLAAFWATLLMLVIVLTQAPLLALLRRQSPVMPLRRGLRDCHDGLVGGARNMIGIGVATAAAGIIVGTITLTGIGQVMIEFVEFLSGGNLLAALVLTALICIVLGMGLPTTANYIVVSSLMAPVVLALASAEGVVVSLIAVHLFVFYFGILADDTPPVGLAAFAAAAIAKSDPIQTGVQGFLYDIRTAILPFMFIFNAELLLIGIEGPGHLLLVVASATVAMLLFAAATQGYWLARSRWWESLALLLVAFSLFRPGFWWDQLYPPTTTLPASALIAQAAQVEANGKLQIQVQGETLEGDWVERAVLLPMGAAGDGENRLREAGLELREEAGTLWVDNVVFGSPAEAMDIDFDWEITGLSVPADRPPKHLVFIPSLALLGLVAWRQRRRAV
ncbi:MAG: TRAP transporter permease [Gammaproteobacteria bacterium]|nr:TRAP transporter permease [Gammaproteobacteria bacterium]